MPKASAGENPLPPKGALSRTNLFNVGGKTAVITGGGSGIGAMMAAALVENGAHVLIASRKDASAFATELQERGPGSCWALSSIDISKTKDVEKLFQFLHKEFLTEAGAKNGKLDILINNAGTNYGAPILDSDPIMVRKVVDLNLSAQLNLTTKLLPLLSRKNFLDAVRQETQTLEKKASSKTPSGNNSSSITPKLPQADPARIIFVSSIFAHCTPDLETYAYAASKAGISHVTKHLASRLAGEGVLVNALAPGSGSS